MKIKALILSFALLFNLLSLPVFSADGEKNTNTSLAVDFLSSLSVTDSIDVSDLSRNLTRAEFASLVVKMLNVSSVTSDDTIYDDVYISDEYGQAIYDAYALGIVSPSDNRCFYPDERITYEAALKMVVAALGYNKYALAMGGYPSGYVAVASKLDITENVNQEFALGDALNLISNAMRTDVWNIESISGGDVVYKSEAGRNLLTENYKLNHISGVVTTAGLYSTNYAYSSLESSFEISGKLFKCNVQEAEKYLGYNVDAWYNDKNEIAAVYVSSLNSVVTLDANDVSEFKNSQIIYNTETKQYSYTVDKGYTFVKNGRYFEQKLSDFSFENGTLTLIDNNGDRKFDFVLARQTEYFVVTAINDLDRILYDSNQTGTPISLERDSNVYSKIRIYNFTKKEYSEGNYDSITVGNLLEVRKSADNELVEIDVITSNILSGIVEEKALDYTVISGKAYETTSYFENSGETLLLGRNVELLLSSGGKIVAKKSFEDELKYGYLLGFGKGSGAFSFPQIKILTESNAVSVYELSDKIWLDGTPYSCKDQEITNTLTDGNVPKYQVVKYRLDKEGKIVALDTANTTPPADGKPAANLEGDNTLIKYVDKKEGHYKTSGLIVPFGLISGAKVFYVPEDLKTTTDVTYGDEFFVCGTSDRLNNDDRPIIDVYDYNENFVPGVVVVYNMTGGASTMVTPAVTAASYMVEKVTQAADADGGISIKLTLCNATSYESYVVSGNVYEEFKRNSILPERGDIVRIALDHKNEINGLAIDVQYNESTGAIAINYLNANSDASVYNSNVSDNVHEQFTYASGKVAAFGDGLMTLDIITWAPKSRYSLVNNKMSYYCRQSNAVLYPGTNGKIRNINAGDIMTETAYGDGNTDMVVVRTGYLQISTVFVYRKN